MWGFYEAPCYQALSLPPVLFKNWSASLFHGCASYSLPVSKLVVRASRRVMDDLRDNPAQRIFHLIVYLKGTMRMTNTATVPA